MEELRYVVTNAREEKLAAFRFAEDAAEYIISLEEHGAKIFSSSNCVYTFKQNLDDDSDNIDKWDVLDSIDKVGGLQ